MLMGSFTVEAKADRYKKLSLPDLPDIETVIADMKSKGIGIHR